MAQTQQVAPTELHFNEAKATEAALRLLMRHGGHMNYMLLIKLLYMADREAMRQWGRPITTDRYVAMNNGPVLSRVLDLIKYGVADSSGQTWTAAISSPEGYEVRALVSTPVQGELSEAEERALDEIDSRFGRWDVWRLVRWMHDGGIPEWSNPGGGAVPISYRDMLAGLGKTPAEIEQTEAELAGVAEMERLIGAG